MSQNIVYDFIKEFSSLELEIQIDKNSVNFIKNKKKYQIEISLDGSTVILQKINDDLENSHFVDVLTKQNFNNVNQLIDLVEFVNKVNLYNYCVVCKEKLDYQSNNLTSCSKTDCLYKFEEIVTGDRVVQKIKDDPDICSFLIKSAIDAIQCNRKFHIFEPFPTHFMNSDKICIERGTISRLLGKNYDKYKDFHKIDKVLIDFNIDKFFETVFTCSCDTELANLINKDLYILIRFILLSCKVDIQKNDDVLGIKSDEFKIYKIVHPIDKEEQFNKVNNSCKSYLFHGSNWCNWYSILRNGLKNCSQTELMTAGAAFGNGVYLSSDIGLSYGYGRSGNQSVVGVFEVADKEKYHKSDTTYVIDSEEVLIQRYLLILPFKAKYSLTHINNIFNKKIYKEKLNIAIQYNKKCLAKIIREYKLLTSVNSDQSRFRVEVNDDYPFLWKIFIANFDDKFEIAQDMKKFNIKEIELEIRFPENYPFSPPFVQIVTPRFMCLTGKITDGSICLEILTEKGWSPTYSMESLITIIISEIIEGDGRIDPVKYSIPYSYDEAKQSFIRVANSCGWL